MGNSYMGLLLHNSCKFFACLKVCKNEKLIEKIIFNSEVGLLFIYIKK